MEIDHLDRPSQRATRPPSASTSGRSRRSASDPLDWPDRHRAYFGLPGEPSSLWLSESPAAGTLELSLPAGDAHVGEGFHAAALVAGGASQHGPAMDSDRSEQIYSARIVDPDGNVLEVVHRGLDDGQLADESSLAA